MTPRELTFGGTPFLIELRAHPAADGGFGYIASIYRIEDNGHAVRPVGDRKGNALEFISSDEATAVARVSDYLTDRFGPPGPEPTWPKEGISRIERQPPLKDERPKA